MLQKFLVRIILVLGVCSFVPLQTARAEKLDGWTTIVSGIDYQQFKLHGPNEVYVSRMTRGNPNVILESAIGSGELASGRETITGMTGRYDDALNSWGGSWGMRDQVVVGINGDYFDPATGYPQNGMIHSGWYDKRYNDYEGWSGLIWSSDRDIFVGQCIVNRPKRQYLTFSNTDQTKRIDGINMPRGPGQLILYTPDYASTTLTDENGLEITLTLNNPVMVVPAPYAAQGWVTDIRDRVGSTPIPFDKLILSASGSSRDFLLKTIHIGDRIGITQEITSLDKDCSTYMDTDWTSAYAGIGGAFTFLRDGQPQHLNVTGAISRHPRTAIAYNKDFVFFIVVDGRAPGFSRGMTLDELADFTRDTLGAKWGIAQDGGGSSTMVIQGKVINRPSDPCVNLQSLNVTQTSWAQKLNLGTIQTPEVYSSNYGATCERPVANGMMMVALQPQENSSAFSTGDVVTASTDTPIRLGPGSNYAGLSTLPAQASTTIRHHSNGLDGIRAKGDYWWFVTYGGVTGWVPQSSLVLTAAQPLESDVSIFHAGMQP